MNDTYCIYLNEMIEFKDSNLEHIFPLSFGGCNEFVIRVDINKNSILGSQIDGKMSNDFLISGIRRHKDLRGHSGEIPKTVLKKSKLTTTNRPIQLVFEGKKSHFFDPIDKRVLTEKESIGQSINSTFKMDMNLRLQFVAKVLLASGYFIYKETFIKYADHESLRRFMNLNITETKESISRLSLKVIDIFHEIPEESKGLTGIFKNLCKVIDGSCVMFLLSTENIIGSVGIAGEYMGTINFKADTKMFPNDNGFRLGHVIGIQDNQLRRNSFYDMTAKLHELMKKNK